MGQGSGTSGEREGQGVMKPDKREPRMISNPRYCERCEGRGYLVEDAEWEPIAVQCPDCKDRRKSG
jgi:DnaJ-class molecular chaperone